MKKGASHWAIFSVMSGGNASACAAPQRQRRQTLWVVKARSCAAPGATMPVCSAWAMAPMRRCW